MLRNAGLLLVVVAVGGLLSACGSPEEAVGEVSDQSIVATVKEVYEVGDTAPVAAWDVVVERVVDPFVSANPFDAPQGRFIGVDVAIKNMSSTSSSVSSVLCFDLRDGDGRQYFESILVGGQPAPDGSIRPGEVLRGTVYYDVPVGVSGLRLRFGCGLVSPSVAFFRLS